MSGGFGDKRGQPPESAFHAHRRVRASLSAADPSIAAALNAANPATPWGGRAGVAGRCPALDSRGGVDRDAVLETAGEADVSEAAGS